MVNINTGGGSGGGGGSSGGSGGGSDGELSQEQREQLRDELDTLPAGGGTGSGGSSGGGGAPNPFEGAQTGSDVFEQGQTIDTTQKTTSGDSGQTTDASGGSGGGSRTVGAPRGAQRAVERTPTGRVGELAATPQGGLRQIQRRSFRERVRQANPDVAASGSVGIGTRVSDGFVEPVAQRSPFESLPAEEQRERNETVVGGFSSSFARQGRTAEQVRQQIREENPGARNIEVERAAGGGFTATFENPERDFDRVESGARGTVETFTGLDLPTEPELVADLSGGVSDVTGVDLPTERQFVTESREFTGDVTGFTPPSESEFSAGLRSDVGGFAGVTLPGEEQLSAGLRGQVADSTGVGLPGPDTSPMDVFAAGAPVALAEPTAGGEAALAGAVFGAGIAQSGDTLTARATDAPTESETIPGASLTGPMDGSEVGVPSETFPTEIPTQGSVFGEPELTVGEGAGGTTTTELGVPTDGMFSSELSPGQGLPTSELLLPGQGDTADDTGDGTGQRDDSVVPGDYPLPGRDVPADPSRDFIQRETPETILGAGQMFGGQQRQRERQRDPVDTIGGENIPTNPFGDIDQPGPGVRERQRRDDLLAPERLFPTGESAVAGRGVSDPAQESQDLLERAQTPSFIRGGGVAGGATLFPLMDALQDQAQRQEVAVRSRQDTRQMLEEAQTPRLFQPTTPGVASDVATDVQQRQKQLQKQRQVQATRNLFGEGFGEVTPNEFGNPNEHLFEEEFFTGGGGGYGFGGFGMSQAPPTQESDDDEGDPFGIGPAGSLFTNPVTSGSSFLFGDMAGGGGSQSAGGAGDLFGFGGGGGDRDGAGGLFSGTMDDSGPFGGWL